MLLHPLARWYSVGGMLIALLSGWAVNGWVEGGEHEDRAAMIDNRSRRLNLWQQEGKVELVERPEPCPPGPRAQPFRSLVFARSDE
jgi:hypothetical protein